MGKSASAGGARAGVPPPPPLLVDGPVRAPLTVVLAHGAGAPMDSPFMSRMASGIAALGYRVARFEFPYMRARRAGKRSGAPDREPVLRAAWAEAVAAAGGGERVVIGGKSLGGRIASLVADELGVRGLICLGYPFHPPGKPETLRTKHLEALRTRALVLQGTRDALGSREEVSGYAIAPTIRIVWIEDGDHSFRPRARSGRTEAQNLEAAVAAAGDFLASLVPP